MKRVLIILFILNLLKVQAQSIDSLKMAALHLKHDTDKVMLFYNEGFANRTIDPQYSYDCAVEAENYAQHSKLPYYVAKASTLLGVLYYRKGDLTDALVYHKKALALRMLIGDKGGIAISQTNLGTVYSSMKMYPLAEAAYLDAIAYNYEIGEEKQIGNCLSHLGVMNLDLNNINGAENYLNAAVANARKRSDYELEAACLNNLSALNIMKKDYDVAIADALNSIKVKHLTDNEMQVADSYLNLCEAYFQKHDYAMGLSSLKSADFIIDKYNYAEARLQSLMKHADFYEQDKNFELAYQCLKKYGALEDSLDEVNANEETQYNFIEKKIVTEPIIMEAHTFPYLLLITLCIIALACVLFLLRFKR